MPSTKRLPERHPLRLPGYDYASPGPYFVTLVTQDRLHLFGKVIDKEMHVNAAGEMIMRWWKELANKYPSAYPGCHVVMPNHFHGILEVSAWFDTKHTEAASMEVAATISPSANLPQMMQWFKTMTTNAYIHGVKTSGWQRFNGKLWQRSYYEHIIRADRSYEWIMKYIEENPSRWDDDEENR